MYCSRRQTNLIMICCSYSSTMPCKLIWRHVQHDPNRSLQSSRRPLGALHPAAPIGKLCVYVYIQNAKQFLNTKFLNSPIYRFGSLKFECVGRSEALRSRRLSRAKWSGFLEPEKKHDNRICNEHENPQIPTLWHSWKQNAQTAKTWPKTKQQQYSSTLAGRTGKYKRQENRTH